MFMSMSPLDRSHVPGNVISIPNRIHPTAIIAHSAKIAPDVTIGPYSIIGEHVTIGQGTAIASHVVIDGWTKIGERNQIGIGAVIGGTPQDLKFQGEASTVTIGHDNIIREYVTINRGTAGGGGQTQIGNHNSIMTSVHVAHDVIIGNHNVIANSTALAGHVIIEDWVTIGGLTGIHQFIQLGRMSMIGGMSKITKDVLPYSMVSGNPARRYGLNIERLRRNGYTATARREIHRAYKILFQDGLSLKSGMNRLKDEFSDNQDVMHVIKFLQASNRSIYR
ncbi:UDP-N-acetylglucosamine acyltransferase [Legionella shakespearei DSM 23087]|uniref:Acyl-[acyl-carrier-protein]--UDP-N-acetylglucosamine O-acyltransferase n=2 Tax=Legionella shakespearei TaxID=45075 RepID=A0A0W0Z4X5_9GAMM|nr:UDP-N-acetylglucosamine acyltransferase [Legionella shakespearei DSM 23087]